METYDFSHSFAMGSLLISPVHVRMETLPPLIAAHRHANASYEIHYAAAGAGSVIVDGQSRPVTAGTLYMTGPAVEHAQLSERENPIVEYCLYLDCQRTSRRAGDPFALFAETTFWMGRDEGRIVPLLEALLEENRRPQPETGEMCETLVRQIVIALTRAYRQNAPQPTVSRAPALTRAGLMPVIEDAFFYRHRDLTLPDLAALLNLSTRQTQRVLQRHFGKTFSQKLTEARMAAAAQLLTTTELSVTDISERLGFSSIEHFSSAFRRAMGCSPRQYRSGGEKSSTDNLYSVDNSAL